MHSLTVVLTVFEIAIIQCKVGAMQSSLGKQQESRTIITPAANEEQQSMNFDLFRKIMYTAGYNTTRDYIREYPGDCVFDLSEILKNHVLCIYGCNFSGSAREYLEGDGLYFEFGTYDKLASYLKKSIEKVKNIQIVWDITEDYSDVRLNATKNFIERNADKLEDLHIKVIFDWEKESKINSVESFGTEFLNWINQIIFPKLKKFVYINNFPTEFILRPTFPVIEWIELDGQIKDAKNWLANTKTLKVLVLYTDRIINEDQIISVFVNNNNLKTLRIAGSGKRETMQAIAEHLKKLEALIIVKPYGNFYSRSPDQPSLFNLSSVKIFATYMSDFDMVRNPSFDMPNLETLILYFELFDDRVIEFIQRFMNLKSLKVQLVDFGDNLTMDGVASQLEGRGWTLLKEKTEKFSLSFERNPPTGESSNTI